MSCLPASSRLFFKAQRQSAAEHLLQSQGQGGLAVILIVEPSLDAFPKILFLK